MEKDHVTWYRTVTKGDSNRQASEMAGLNNATLGRQLNAGKLSAENVIRIAEAYGESPIVSLVDLGFMSSRWINEQGALTSLRKASDEELTDELLRRLKLLPDEQVDELAQRRMSGASGSMPNTAVADDSPDEDRMREDEDGDWTDPDNIP